MGKSGPLPKPKERLQRRNVPGPNLTVVEGTKPAKIPRPPPGLSTPVRKAWRTYWSSPMATLITDIDQQAVRRLFKLYEHYERAVAAMDLATVVKGSMGQVRVNPVADLIAKFAPQILRLENELGMTPMSRARLGLTLAQGELTVDEINRRAREHGRDEDPRIIEAQIVPADDAAGS